MSTWIKRELQLFLHVEPTYPTGEKRPKYRGLSHLISFYTLPYIFFTVQSFFIRSVVSYLLTAIMITGFFALFGISGHFHRLPKTLEEHYRWMRWDHSSIVYYIGVGVLPFGFLMIRNCPDPTIGYAFLILNAMVLSSGVTYNMTKTLTERQSSTSIAFIVVQATVLFPFAYYLYPLLTTTELVWLGIKYLLQLSGMLIYIFQWCDWSPETFGHHEVFHLFTILGSLSSMILPSICARI